LHRLPAQIAFAGFARFRLRLRLARLIRRARALARVATGGRGAWQVAARAAAGRAAAGIA
jgi:hypothetical protein